MPDAAIEVAGLRKTFRGLRGGRRTALDGLDLVVPAGGTVHGFLGPNGSGKTTTVRILLGLVAADAGTMRMLGRPVPAELAAVVPHVGAIVESPLFFPAFTGRRNLELLAGVAGLPDRRVDEVLEQVGLSGREHDRVKGYSLGMRQRLAVAAALLKAPALLLLDEPSNGLDPAGIREMRDTLRRLADSGVTVLLSSHLLAEVQQVCDSVSIISRGRHVTSGAVRDVLAARGTGEIRVRLAAPAAGARALAAAGFPVRDEGGALVVRADDGARVSECLAGAGLYPSELVALHADLEDVFLELTGPAGGGAPPGGPPAPRPAPEPVRS